MLAGALSTFAHSHNSPSIGIIFCFFELVYFAFTWFKILLQGFTFSLHKVVGILINSFYKITIRW